jgi:predicted ATPase
MFGLHLKNYKSFEDQQFDFSKINILIGTNSSGKSALLKFFLMLKQSTNVIYGNQLILNDSNIDLGSFEDIVTDNDENRNIEIEFLLNIDKPQIISQNAWMEDLPNGAVKLKYKFDKDLFIKNIQISHSDLGEIQINVAELIEEQTRFFSESQKYNIIYEHNGDEEKYINVLCKPKGLALFLDNNSNIPKKIQNLLLYTLPFSIFIQHLKYFNPFFSKPERNYSIKNYSNADSIGDLENAIQVLKNGFRHEELNVLLRNALNDLEIAEDFKIEKADNIKVLELKIKPIGDTKFRNIADVGFGTSLQIPLLLQVISNNRLVEGATILLEQPEIHIHPKLQAKLMEVLVKYGEKNTYFIETHSIHFIEALQVMVKEKKIKKEDITIHYFTKENNRTKVSLHSIDDDGFLNTPISEDFMDVSYNLVSKLLH